MCNENCEKTHLLLAWNIIKSSLSEIGLRLWWIPPPPPGRLGLISLFYCCHWGQLCQLKKFFKQIEDIKSIMKYIHYTWANNENLCCCLVWAGSAIFGIILVTSTLSLYFSQNRDFWDFDVVAATSVPISRIFVNLWLIIINYFMCNLSV